MIQNMVVSTLNSDGTKTELYRSNTGDSEATIMENVMKTFPALPESDIVTAESDKAAEAIDREMEKSLEKHPDPKC